MYEAHRPETDPEKEIEVNQKMFERVIVTLNRLSPNLKFVVFPSGTKVHHFASKSPMSAAKTLM